MIETFKFGYGQRSNLADPVFVPGMSEILENLLERKTWRETRKLILDSHTNNNVDYYGGGFYQEDHGTTHLNVASQNEMVALTQSINFAFGAGFRGKRTGIIFNDEMDDFSIPGKINDFGFPPSEVNFIEPGKRPQSSTCPTIIKRNGRNFSAVGGSGGSRITTAVTQNVVNLLNFGMNITDYVAGPRIHHQLSPMAVGYQPGYRVVFKNVPKMSRK